MTCPLDVADKFDGITDKIESIALCTLCLTWQARHESLQPDADTSGPTLTTWSSLQHAMQVGTFSKLGWQQTWKHEIW